MKFIAVSILILILKTTTISVSALTCYDCPLRHYNFSITPHNIPEFKNCTTNETTGKFCSLNIYSDDNGKTSKLRAHPHIGDEHANISYILTGFAMHNNFEDAISYGILYQCMTNNCNNPELVLKRLLEATVIETYKPPELFSPMNQPDAQGTLVCSSFTNFSNIAECKPPFYHRKMSNDAVNCSTYCVTAIKIDSTDLTTERMCSYCEQQTTERFRYIDERVHLLDKKISYLQQLEYLCNSSDYCNSIENIRQIQQRYNITFDFDVFFHSTAAIIIHQSYIVQFFACFLIICFLFTK